MRPQDHHIVAGCFLHDRIDGGAIDNLGLHDNVGMLGREHFFLLVKRRLDGCVHHLGLGAKLFRLSGIHDRKKHQACTRARRPRSLPSTPTRMLAIGGLRFSSS